MLLGSIGLGYTVSRHYSEPANGSLRSRAYPATAMTRAAKTS
jgi:hypothetical protein